MATAPNSWRFASATKAFPAPTIMSTGAAPSRPNAMAASAWTPPTTNSRSTPDTYAAYATAAFTPPSGCGGVQATTVGTPAAFATPTLMNALAVRGKRPAGRYAPTLPTGT
jgi:hypothetical protein